MKKLLLAIMLTCVAATGSAECRLFKPDGSVLPCPPQVQPAQPAPEQLRVTLCEMGVMLANKAYLYATPDAMYPSAKNLHYAVDYWGDMMDVKHDSAIAHKAVIYIALRMQPTGMRKPWDGAVYEAAREFIISECK